MISKFYKWGIYGNKWLWFHIAAGMLGFGLGYRLDFVFWQTFYFIAIAAVGWEIVEYFIECGGNPERIIEIYGSLERWLYDSLGDVVMPLVLGTGLWYVIGGA